MELLLKYFTLSESYNGNVALDGEKLLVIPADQATLAIREHLPCYKTHSFWYSPINRALRCNVTPITLLLLSSARGLQLTRALREASEKYRARLLIAQEIKRLQYGETTRDLAVPGEKTKSWFHQAQAFHFAINTWNAMLAMEMGTGKTKVAIDLVRYWGAKRTIVLCPKSVIRVWASEISKHAHENEFNVLLLEFGTLLDKRKAILGLNGCPRPAIVVVNYETARIPEFGATLYSVKWDVAIADESHRLKNPKTQTALVAHTLSEKAKHKLALTGTPIGQTPLDLFSQFRFLDPAIFGASWTRFKSRYAVFGNPHIPQMVTGIKNEQELIEKASILTYVCKASEVLELPSVRHIDRVFTLGAKARAVYDNLERDFVALIGENTITAPMILTRMLRLQQITSGFVGLDNGEIEVVDRAREDALRDLIDGIDASEQVVIFCRFRYDLATIQRIAMELEREYGEISGDSKTALTQFGKLDPAIKIAGVQIASGGLGIDLSSACFGVYYNVGFSLQEYSQSIARLVRPGQTRKVTFFHLLAEDTIDQYVYSALKNKEEIAEGVVSRLRNRCHQ